MTIETVLPQARVDLMAPLVERLAEAFARNDIVYCHWKSNIHLAEAAAGEQDLDLLVDRRCLAQALAVLSATGFKPAVARWGPNAPGITHYYGFDETTEELVHVHLFSALLTGESYVKSHLFPFEGLLLQNTHFYGPLRVTNRQAELVLFTLRAFVKYGSLPDLLHLWRKTASLKREVTWLEEGGNREAALSLLATYCPVVEKGLFVDCLDAVSGDSSLITRILLARRVRRRLKVYVRHGFWGRVARYAQLLFAEVSRRVGTKRKNKALRAGGAVIAFVGAEATGKSTLVAETVRWLGGTFAVSTVHAGKPPATLLTAPVSLLLPALRRRLSSFRTNKLEGHSGAGASPSSPDEIKGIASLVYAARAVILAWERRQLLLTARRAAANGDLVICDRYPSDTVGAMDSPRLREQQKANGIVPALVNGFARLEGRLYQQIAPPDIVLRLNVTIETAQRRNRERAKVGKEGDAYVASRHRHAREWQNSGTKFVYDIDTEQSLPQTIHCVKKAIWECL